MILEKELPESNEPEGINLFELDPPKAFTTEQELRIREILQEELHSVM